jgi:hypothetical protein
MKVVLSAWRTSKSEGRTVYVRRADVRNVLCCHTVKSLRHVTRCAVIHPVNKSVLPLGYSQPDRYLSCRIQRHPWGLRVACEQVVIPVCRPGPGATELQ